MRAYLQLVRIPNVFTAMADILLGFLLTHRNLQPWWQFALLLVASCLIYMAGMALNDYFDRERDAIQRPQRPIPSGRVSAGTALRLGLALLGAGAGLAWLASLLAADPRPAIVATLLAGAVLLYDGAAKRTPAGPLVMGACRSLNVLLGMSLSEIPWQAVNWAVALGIGVYIAGVTLLARTEAARSSRGQLAAGLAVLLGGLALVSSLPFWARGFEWPPLQLPERWFVFWGLIALLVAARALRAIADPQPAKVQAAVRNAIFALVIIDAATVLAVQERVWALVILALLLPMLVLGRWIYST